MTSMVESSADSLSALTANQGLLNGLSRGDARSLCTLWNPKKGSVAHTLATQPQSFDFFQAILVIEQIAKRNDATLDESTLDDRPRLPIGRFHRIEQEAIRLSSPATSAFPTAQIESLRMDDRQRPWMVVNFMGLTGPSGMLPRSYTQLLAQVDRDGRGKERYALRDFLDQFNHRLLSLFYGAWTKYRFPVRYLRDGAGKSLVDVALASAAGLASTQPENHVLPREQLLGFAGLLAQNPATAGNLEAVLGRLLEVEVRVLQFQPSVLELDEDSQCCLGIDNGCGQLGLNAVVGPRTMTRQHKICVQLGPLTVQQFSDYLPGNPPASGYSKVAEVVRTFVGHALEYDLRLQLHSSDLEGCRLEAFDAEDRVVGSRLGFDSWLQSDAWPEILDDAIIPGVCE